MWLWAKERQEAKPKRLRNAPAYGKRNDNLSIHLDGIKGEYAVAKLFCLAFENNHLPGGHGHTPDLILPDGTTIQIKYRAQRGWDYALSSDNPAEFISDIGILCWPVEDSDDIDVVGYVERDYFIRHAKRVNYLQRAGGERLALGDEHFCSVCGLLEAHWQYLGAAA